MDMVFAGTPRFAEVALQALLEAGHRIKLVLTQPDRASGRGRRVQPPPVKRLAQRHGLPVLQPTSLRDPGVIEAIAARSPDVMVVTAYGLLIPRAILSLPRRGCINIHASLLPRWRGAAPIQRALIAGDAKTGITIMQMDEGLDTGPVLLQESIPIASDDTAGTLHDHLAMLGARLIVEALVRRCTPRPQGGAGISYAAKIDKDEARIDWSEDAALIERKLRAFDPEPGAYTRCGGDTLKIWRAHVESGVHGTPGAVLEIKNEGILVACGSEGLRLTELQRAGGKRLLTAAFLAGYPFTPGTRLG